MNKDFKGGQTFFPRLDIDIECETGKALVFKNCISDSGYLHPNSLHGSRVITSGEKKRYLPFGCLKNMNKFEKITVIGAGYVGSSIAALFGQRLQVTLVDIDEDKLKLIKNNKVQYKTH